MLHAGVTWPGPRRIAIVGAGPAGLCAAMALISHTLAEHDTCNRHGLPRLVISIFEKRAHPSRRNHVFLAFNRLRGQVAQALCLDVSRLERLLEVHGVSSAPGRSLELRVLEKCLQIMLKEMSMAARGQVAVRWFPRSFAKENLSNFDDVIGSDGRHSAVRQLLMTRTSNVQLAQRALAIEFAYNCHLEWQVDQGVHTLKQHKYQSWQPCLLYHRPGTKGPPDYVTIDQRLYDVIHGKFKQRANDGFRPYTTPFSSGTEFLELMADTPGVQADVRSAFLAQVMDFHEASEALITPVEQTLHRASLLISHPDLTGKDPSLWLLGDAAVGLPISKGCNLIYHMASAGKLASALLTRAPHEYEHFVFENWHREVWRESRLQQPAINKLPYFSPRLDGRFTS
jgi:2-polyprenyl-6-methoxyphenol hydroxylase-like FAD-dependent oxidoreductase